MRILRRRRLLCGAKDGPKAPSILSRPASHLQVLFQSKDGLSGCSSSSFAVTDCTWAVLPPSFSPSAAPCSRSMTGSTSIGTARRRTPRLVSQSWAPLSRKMSGRPDDHRHLQHDRRGSRHPGRRDPHFVATPKRRKATNTTAGRTICGRSLCRSRPCGPSIVMGLRGALNSTKAGRGSRDPARTAP